MITYVCKCGEDNSLLPDFAKYLLEYMKTDKRAQPVCRKCEAPVPVKKLYRDYLKKTTS